MKKSIESAEIGRLFFSRLDARLMKKDNDNWEKILCSLEKTEYVPLQYKPGFLRYQEAYFSDVYDGYTDISNVIYRGGYR